MKFFVFSLFSDGFIKLFLLVQHFLAMPGQQTKLVMQCNH